MRKGESTGLLLWKEDFPAGTKKFVVGVAVYARNLLAGKHAPNKLLDHNVGHEVC